MRGVGEGQEGVLASVRVFGIRKETPTGWVRVATEMVEARIGTVCLWEETG